MEKPKKFWTESRYKSADTFGLAINLLVCTILGIVRAFANVQSYKTGVVDHRLSSWVLNLYITQTSLLVVSAVFLGDALRMLGN